MSILWEWCKYLAISYGPYAISPRIIRKDSIKDSILRIPFHEVYGDLRKYDSPYHMAHVLFLNGNLH